MAEEQKYASEVIDLPSGGKIYGKNSPLYEGKVEIKYMTAKEEDILTSANLIKKGAALEKLMNSLILTPGVDINDLIMGDKNAMASFATSNYYDGVLTYLKGQVPKESGPGKKQPPTNITSLIKDSIVKSQNEFGEDVGINNKASNKNIALALANSFPSGYGHDEFASREAAFILFKDSWKNNKYAKIDDETIKLLNL